MLKVKYISSNSNFCFKLSMDIALIVALFISLSALISGLTLNFETLIFNTTGGESIYFIANEKGMTLEQSKIPKEIITKIDRSLTSYFTPIYDEKVFLNNNAIDMYYLNLSEIINNKESFNLKIDDLPNNSDEIIVGKGLWDQYFSERNLPLTVNISINGSDLTKIIVGIFEDFSPWYFGLVVDITKISDNIDYYSGFEFRIKNQLVFEVFEENTNTFIEKNSKDLKIDYINLKKSNTLVKSLYQELNSLFLFLSSFIFILLAIKVFHSTWMLFTKLKENMVISKIIGMETLQIQYDFWLIILILGNIGVLFGLSIGLALPQAISLFISLLSEDIQTNFTPNIMDVAIAIIVTNLIFVLSSFWVKTLGITNKDLNLREIFK